MKSIYSFSNASFKLSPQNICKVTEALRLSTTLTAGRTKLLTKMTNLMMMMMAPAYNSGWRRMRKKVMVAK
jgi:hypothetical protein